MWKNMLRTVMVLVFYIIAITFFFTMVNTVIGSTVYLEDIDSGFTSPTGDYRWLDIANQSYSSSYRNSYNYTQASVIVTYYEISNVLQGNLTANNLKPNFAYQLKLAGSSGTPCNELIGLAGRWWQEEWNGTSWSNGQNLNNKGNGSSPNPNDIIYFTRKNITNATSPTGLKYRYTGYLVFDYFITDEYGNASLNFETNSSYHVLWKTSQRTRTVDDGPLKSSTFDANTSSPAYDTDYPPQTVDLFGEWERLPVGGIFLQSGYYSTRLMLTEESFHGDGGQYAGNWAGAMGNDISFEIPDVSSTTNRFAVIADARNYITAGLNPTLDYINTLNPKPDFIIYAGDMDPISVSDSNFSDHGWYVNSTTYDVIYVIGNHDSPPVGEAHFQNNIAPYYPNNTSPSYAKENYPGTLWSFNYGNYAHIVVTNQYWNDSNGGYIQEQLDWLSSDLENYSNRQCFVVGHEPAFPFNRHVGDSLDYNTTMRNEFWQILEDNNVRVFLCGHTHYASLYQNTSDGCVQVDAGCARGVDDSTNPVNDIVIIDVNNDNTSTIDYFESFNGGAFQRFDADFQSANHSGDSCGNVDPPFTVGISSIVDFSSYKSISLKENWNLVSLTFSQTVIKADIFVSYFDNNYTWNDAVNQGIILDFFYNWNSSSQSYDIANFLEPGHGYWTWAYYDCELLLVGNRDDDDYITDLNMNWNLMGIPYNESIDKYDLVIRYNNSDYSWYEATTNNNEEGEPLILDFIYKWNTNTQNYILTNMLSTGDGYWMYAYYNHTLIRTVL